MAITLVQSNNANPGTVSSTTLAYSSNVAAGNTLLAFVRLGSNTVSVSSITDTLGNTWTLVKRQQHASSQVTSEIWKCENITSGGANTLSFTFSGSSTLVQLYIAEVNSSTGYAGEDQKNSADQASGTSHNAGSITTTKANSIVFFMIGFVGSYDQDLPPTGYSVGVVALSRMNVWYKILTAIGTENPTMTTDSAEITSNIIANFGETQAAASTPSKKVLIKRF